MKRTEKAELIAMAASVLMAAGMITVYFMSKSLSILAEGLDTVFDIVTCAAVLAGLRISERKTRTFPSGLYKVENLVAVILGIIILFGAYELCRESIERLTSKPVPLDNPWLVVVVMTIVVMITAALAWYKGKVGREENSPSLKADSRHSWTDVVASFGIVIGILMQIMGIKIMDALTALIISLFLAWSGLTVILEGLKVLLDASIEKEVLQKVRSIVEADTRVRHVVSVEGRNSGSYRFLEISIVPRQYDLKEDSKLAADLEQAIRERIEKVDRVTVDLGIEDKGTTLCAVPLLDKSGSIAGSIEDARFFELFEVEQKSFSVISRENIEKPLGQDETINMRAAAFLARLGLNVLVVRNTNFDNCSYWILDECGVKVLSNSSIATLADFENILPGIISAG